MSYTPPATALNHNSRPGRRKAWVAMCAASVAVALASFFVFGVFGGFMLLIGLNGFSERQAQPIFIAYFAIVLGLTTLVAALFNWLIIRRGYPAAGLPGWVALVPAAASALGLLLVGPALALVLMKVIF